MRLQALVASIAPPHMRGRYGGTLWVWRGARQDFLGPLLGTAVFAFSLSGVVDLVCGGRGAGAGVGLRWVLAGITRRTAEAEDRLAVAARHVVVQPSGIPVNNWQRDHQQYVVVEARRYCSIRKRRGSFRSKPASVSRNCRTARSTFFPVTRPGRWGAKPNYDSLRRRSPIMTARALWSRARATSIRRCARRQQGLRAGRHHDKAQSHGLFHSNNMKYQEMKFGKLDDVVKAYDAGQCDTLTGDVSQLYALRLNLASRATRSSFPT